MHSPLPVRSSGKGLTGRLWHPPLWVGVFSALFLGGTGLIAARKPLWYDELFTVYLARLSRPGELWSALAGGTDLNPPLGYLACRATERFLGENALAVRLPALLGFWVLCL